MQLMRLGQPGHEIPVVRVSDVEYDLRSLTSDIDGVFFADGGIARVRAALAAGELSELKNVEGMRTAPPVARPSAVVCIGQNYSAHAAETGDPPPVQPIVFYKHPNTIVGAFDEVHLPPGASALDWEVELGVVIGSRARYLRSFEEASRVIAGFVVANDVSERDFQVRQSGGQWSKGKSCETFNPLGPYLVPADEVDGQNLRLWSRVNGEPRQDSSTADMIFSITEIVHHLSQYMVLEPGDVINTGTPQGVALSGRFPYLTIGDVVEVGIEHLGSQRQVIVAAPAPD